MSDAKPLDGRVILVAGKPWVSTRASSSTAEPMRNCTTAVPTTASGSSSIGNTTFLT